MGVDFTPDQLFAGSGTTTVFLFTRDEAPPSGIWVTFKTELDYGEDLAVTSALFRGMSMEQKKDAVAASEAQGSSSVLITDLALQKQLKLALWISDWNFRDALGKSVAWPKTPSERFQVIGSLGKKTGEWLEARVDEIIKQYEGVQAADPDAPEALSDPLDRQAGNAVLDLTPLS